MLPEICVDVLFYKLLNLKKVNRNWSFKYDEIIKVILFNWSIFELKHGIAN